MLKTVRRVVAVLTLVITTVITGLTVMAPPASAAEWDPTMPSEWRRRALFAGGIPSNLRLDVQYGGGHGTPVHLWSSSNAPTQVWVEEAADQGGFYLHPGFNRWLCLDFDGDRAAGATLKVNNCNGSASQRWHEGFQYDHAFGLVTHSDNQYCVDVPTSNFSSGQILQIWGCNQTNAQRIYHAGCYEDSCLGRNPETMGCGLVSQVRVDFTVNSSRVTLHYSSTCNSNWGRMTAGQGINIGRKVLIQRYWHRVIQDQFSSDYLLGGQTGFTSMYGRGLGWTFSVCFDDTHNGGPLECSGLVR
ncbi:MULTISPECIES: ricin-type beta-trefoil lectin domain protein [Micromonospora]|uniref:ricin-type beta-trefoil lectin domain protein n=1 Tax=Micromonospora TaxID=1873 RepID=UPI001EE8FF90|nr:MULTISPECIES: ricin-type beta-trefoil lectin domain protein [Micromonospora]MCG5448595.1 ricin-type beta-trefoil lectin domain protein [Micromonospora hortensis]MCX5117955.1 ricin-type beta-trefoil lectin domain protein [Micromonospora sp. NBC_00362]WTI09853.1 ricin-type beta-trefoil lectin domain protein [Micromonospora sp. NBC_00821]